MANTYERTDKQSFSYHTWDFDSDGTGEVIPWNGGKATMGVEQAATYDGGTLRFEWSLDGVSWLFTLFEATNTASRAQNFTLGPGFIRTTLVGSTSPTLKAVLV